MCNRADPVERHAAAVSVATTCILNGANIVRVHNIRYGVDGAKVSDELRMGRRG